MRRLEIKSLLKKTYQVMVKAEANAKKAEEKGETCIVSRLAMDIAKSISSSGDYWDEASREEEFPACCALQILSDVESTPLCGTTHEDHWVACIIQRILINHVYKNKGYGFYFTSTSRYTTPKIRKKLKRLGFIETWSWSQHGNYKVYAYNFPNWRVTKDELNTVDKDGLSLSQLVKDMFSTAERVKQYEDEDEW